jgi:2,3-bisphosphoglycerate-independent phosphoglycerate mutase
MDVKLGDVAARANFCTLDKEGKIIDRRAGRIASEKALPIVELLKEIAIPEVETEVRLVREYRFAVVMRGSGLHPALEDTDPQKTGAAPFPVRVKDDAAQGTADLFNAWIQSARKVLADQPKANGLTLRGFSTNPALPQFPDVFGLKAVCIAVYPMYRGVSSLVGMEVHYFSGESPRDQFTQVRQTWNEYDFFFVHIKKPDSKGEDGDFAGKTEVISSVDEALPELIDLKPDVLVVTGDHSTPSRLRSHSWHPVPLLLWAPSSCRSDSSTSFGESTCALGGLGTFPATDILPLSMAHAGRLAKYGA